MRLYVDNQGIFNMEFQEQESASDFLLRFKTENHIYFKGPSQLQETHTGRAIPDDEIMLNRDYYLTAWLGKAE